MSEMSELMAKDPLGLTIVDVTEIVTWYRDNGHKFIEAKKLKIEKLPKAPKGSVDLSTLEIKL